MIRAVDDTPILVGGWFHAGKVDRVCTMDLPSSWWGCSSFPLYASKGGSDAIWIFPAGGRPTGPVDASDASASTRAVVLRIHTHDAACQDLQKECLSRPVADEIVWKEPTK